MLESYFSKYDKLIPPFKRSPKTKGATREKIKQQQPEVYSTLQTSVSKECKKNPIANKSKDNNNNVNNGLSTQNVNIKTSPNELKGLYFTERKNNLELKHENSSLKEQIAQLQLIISEKDNTIKKMKIESDKDCVYLLNLEKMITTLQSKLRNQKTINVSKLKLSGNNDNNKKENLTENNITNKNKEISNISNIESILTQVAPINSNDNINDEVIKLKDFKSEIIELSKENEEININILTSLKKIEELFFNLEQTYKEGNVNISQHKNFYNLKYSTLNEVKENYDKVMASIIESLKKKHEEYVYIIKTKEEESKLLLREIDELKREKDDVLQDNIEKAKRINTLITENEFIKMRDQYNFDLENKQTESNERKTIVSSKYRNNLGKVKDLRNSVKRSVKK